MSFSTGSDFVLLSNTVSFKSKHFQLKLKKLKYHSDLQNILRTQCTPNRFILKHFDFKMCF